MVEPEITIAPIDKLIEGPETANAEPAVDSLEKTTSENTAAVSAPEDNTGENKVVTPESAAETDEAEAKETPESKAAESDDLSKEDAQSTEVFATEGTSDAEVPSSESAAEGDPTEKPTEVAQETKDSAASSAKTTEQPAKASQKAKDSATDSSEPGEHSSEDTQDVEEPDAISGVIIDKSIKDDATTIGSDAIQTNSEATSEDARPGDAADDGAPGADATASANDAAPTADATASADDAAPAADATATADTAPVADDGVLGTNDAPDADDAAAEAANTAAPTAQSSPTPSREDEVDAMMQSVLRAAIGEGKPSIEASSATTSDASTKATPTEQAADDNEANKADAAKQQAEPQPSPTDDISDDDLDEPSASVAMPEPQRIADSRKRSEARRAYLFDSIPVLDPLPEPESVRVLQPESEQSSTRDTRKAKDRVSRDDANADSAKPALVLGFETSKTPSKPATAQESKRGTRSTAKAKTNAQTKAEPKHKAQTRKAQAAEKPATKLPTLEEDLKAMSRLERRLFAHRYAELELETFGATIDPIEALEDRSEALAVLTEEDHELLCKDEVTNMLERLTARSDELDPTTAAQVRVLARDQHRIAATPAHLQANLVRLSAEAYEVWVNARNEDDWRIFAPYLDRLVNLRRKIALAQNPDAHPYDTLLDEFEPGTDREFYNDFFDHLKKSILPLLAAIKKSLRTLSRACVEGRFDGSRQWDIAYDICDLMGINKKAHYLTATIHPFSEAMTSHYAVTAAAVKPDDLMSNVYTMLHELGHNLYEQGVNPDFNRTSLKGGTSMGMHESQSRFFENYVGRDRAFAGTLLKLMRSHFPGQLGRVTDNQLYRAVNCVEPSLIRTEADEVTYPLHIIIRYEIEEQLLSGTITAREVPKVWADLYESYLGVRPKNNVEGALQDVHWSAGDFGYFPAYALGNAYAAQIRAKIIEDGVNWQRTLQTGDLAPLRTWLQEHIWQYGRSEDARTLIEEACGKPFDATYYTDYLTKKYDSLYNLRML